MIFTDFAVPSILIFTIRKLKHGAYLDVYWPFSLVYLICFLTIPNSTERGSKQNTLYQGSVVVIYKIIC